MIKWLMKLFTLLTKILAMHNKKWKLFEKDDDNCFMVGNYFEHFAYLEARAEKFENSHFVKFQNRVEATRKQMNKAIKNDLKYYASTVGSISTGKEKGIKACCKISCLAAFIWLAGSDVMLAIMQKKLFNTYSFIV